jgi:hypothetical protein
LADVRLISEGRQVPFVRSRSAAPELVLSVVGASPKESGRDRSSSLKIALPAKQMPLTQLELTSMSGPFTRHVTVEYEKGRSRPGAQQATSTMSVYDGEWSCKASEGPLCRLAVPLGTIPTSELRVVFWDWDNAPLPSVGVRVWRLADAIRFVHPAQTVTLVAGNESLSAPVYDIESVRTEILDQPAQRVVAERTPPAAGPDAASRALLLGAVVVAGASLLLLLARLTRG